MTQDLDSTSPLAGKPAPAAILIDPAALERAYYERAPDTDDPAQRVAFGTSGHRGSSLAGAFNEAHILAVTQAICEYRRARNITGPLFLGKDTHALSAPAERSALEVLAANDATVVVQEKDGITPTPAISHAILRYNRDRVDGLADGIVVTPSHNPPEDGGFKYNPPDGGPADTDVTKRIQDRANELLRAKNADVRRVPYERARASSNVREIDFARDYVAELGEILDMRRIREADLRLGVDPLGGAAAFYWERINEVYGLKIAVVNTTIDPTFSFMSVDRDGKIRMDCSSPYAMARLVEMKDRFQLAFGNDTDADRHGIVTPSAGLLNPNHYLSVAVRYLLAHRPRWPQNAAVGKTLVSSGMIDRVVAEAGRTLREVPVGFKWFVSGLLDGSCCFGGEESAGASFLRHDGAAWSTDKDGLIMNLLAAEILAVTGRDPGEHYRDLTERYGTAHYARIDAPASPEEKAALAKLSPDAVASDTLAGEEITAKLVRAPGNDAPIGGLKVTTKNGWFAARPSGTENIYKIYAESLTGEAHLQRILTEAREVVGSALRASAAGA